jgi:magnesium transporter
MLTAYPSGVAAPTWLDLVNPTDAERASIETRYGLQLPTRAELSEIESSSRISEESGILYLSMPIVAHADALDQAPSPLGFMLSKDLLVTIRYTPLRSFEAAAAKLTKNGGRATSVETFATLIDEMVDMGADLLEGIAAELDATSSAIFPKLRKGRRRQASTSNDALRRLLIDVGNIGERLSRIRDILLGLQRIVPFVSAPARDWISHETQDRLKTAQTDVLSLTDYETHLSNKVQFLLDAVLGLINTKQNDIFTVLTVVSVVGIPPTLVASIYGMNFKNMPELSWAWGYQWGLAMIALSTIVPILWFKWRGWL